MWARMCPASVASLHSSAPRTWHPHQGSWQVRGTTSSSLIITFPPSQLAGGASRRSWAGARGSEPQMAPAVPSSRENEELMLRQLSRQAASPSPDPLPTRRWVSLTRQPLPDNGLPTPPHLPRQPPCVGQDQHGQVCAVPAHRSQSVCCHWHISLAKRQLPSGTPGSPLPALGGGPRLCGPGRGGAGPRAPAPGKGLAVETSPAPTTHSSSAWASCSCRCGCLSAGPGAEA